MPHPLFVGATDFRHLRGGADRRERIAQFMREHREQFILAPASTLRRLIQLALSSLVMVRPHSGSVQ
jgi:hypothetical protein